MIPKLRCIALVVGHVTAFVWNGNISLEANVLCFSLAVSRLVKLSWVKQFFDYISSNRGQFLLRFTDVSKTKTKTRIEDPVVYNEDPLRHFNSCATEMRAI